MKYGHFEDARREYVIVRPDTPTPWLNYLGGRGLIGLISNTAGGYTFYRDARLRRLTRYRYNDVPSGENGRYLYVRDEDDGTYWSPTWRPARAPVDDFHCRHGLGYTVIGSTYREIEVEALYFIPSDSAVEVCSVRVTNRRSATAAISMFAAVEFCLWDAQDDATNFQRNLSIGEVEAHGGTIFHKTGCRERRDHFASFSCSEPTIGFDTKREAFLGAYRGWDRPIGVERGVLSNSLAVGGTPIGAHQVRLTVEPGEEKRVVFLLGYHENHAPKFDSSEHAALRTGNANSLIARFFDKERIDRELTRLREDWDKTLGRLQVSVPALEADRMINTWTPYQCVICFNVARSASGYEAGIGRGIGFRDANQDLLGCVHLLPESARQRLLDLASTQLASGGAYHQYQLLTRKGNDAIGSGFNDDPLWLILAASAYLKETGDWSILDEPVCYSDGPALETALYEHLIRAGEYTLARLGPHGLPLIGRADWNDCLNLNSNTEDPDESFQTAPQRTVSIAESVFIAGLFGLVAPELAEIATRRGDAAVAQRFFSSAEEMRRAVETHAWDGNWYLRAYNAAGDRIGSEDCDEGQIYIEPQGMCTMAGFGLSDGRARAALDAVHERLLTDHGLMLLQPPYTRYNTALGEISSYPPGYKENGSIFSHTNPWIIIAECLLERGDRAWDYAMRLNPACCEEIGDIRRCEPYVYAQTIAGRDAADHGLARNSWLTGTASWMYVALTQWILGIRPTYDGLMIAPCIPPNWAGYKVARVFRNATYDIYVENPSRQSCPVRDIHVDGEAIAGPILPVFADGKTHRVDVTLGSAR